MIRSDIRLTAMPGKHITDMCAECRTTTSVPQDKACSMAELSMLPCSKNASRCVGLLPESKSPFNAAARAVESCTKADELHEVL